MSLQESRMQLRRGTAANLAAANEVPLAGELVVETDTGMVKAGDGVRTYNDLEYIGRHGLNEEILTFVLDDEVIIEKKIAIWT